MGAYNSSMFDCGNGAKSIRKRSATSKEAGGKETGKTRKRSGEQKTEESEASKSK